MKDHLEFRGEIRLEGRYKP